MGYACHDSFTTGQGNRISDFHFVQRLSLNEVKDLRLFSSVLQ
jgi:hypothetical protein